MPAELKKAKDLRKSTASTSKLQLLPTDITYDIENLNVLQHRRRHCCCCHSSPSLCPSSKILYSLTDRQFLHIVNSTAAQLNNRQCNTHIHTCTLFKWLYFQERLVAPLIFLPHSFLDCVSTTDNPKCSHSP